MVKVKICGVTNEEDALWVVNLGGHYVGFNFYKESPRKVSPAQAAKIIEKLPPFVIPVGVFVDHTVDEILKIVSKTGVKGVQIHGPLSADDCRALKEKLPAGSFLIKAFRVGEESDLAPMESYKDVCDYFLLDAKVEGEMGGTGQTFPWELLSKAKEQNIPLFLAGGLAPENVKEAVKKTQPFAVDVASGVEKTPKRKDYNKLKLFFEEAKKG